MKELWQIIKDAWREFEYKLALWIKRKFSRKIIIQEDYDEWYRLIYTLHQNKGDWFKDFPLLEKSRKLEQLADEFYSEEVFYARVKENLPTLKIIMKFIHKFRGEFSRSDLKIIDELASQIERNLDKSILFLESLQEIRNEDLRNMARTFKEGG